MSKLASSTTPVLTKKNEHQFCPDGILLSQGAEAKIYKTIQNGKQTIVKHRFSKTYRHPVLDKRIRSQRTNAEVRSMKKAKENGIRVPQVFYNDKKNTCIYMEFMDYPMVKTLLKKSFDEEKKYDDNCHEIIKQVGKNIGLLHKCDMLHGDLTTSNILYDKDKNEVIMIDFGLAQQGNAQWEQKAVDLYVMERAFLSTHPNSDALVELLLESYKKAYPSKHKEVFKKLEIVRMRGRKRSMVG